MQNSPPLISSERRDRSTLYRTLQDRTLSTARDPDTSEWVHAADHKHITKSWYWNITSCRYLNINILPFPAQYSGKLPARFKTCCNDPGVMVQGREHQLMETTQYFRLVSIFFWVCLFPLNCLKSCFPMSHHFPETICQRIPTSLHPSMCLRSPMWPSLGDSRVAPSLFLAACQLFPVIIMWMEARRAGRALPFLESLGTLQHGEQQAPGPS